MISMVVHRVREPIHTHKNINTKTNADLKTSQAK